MTLADTPGLIDAVRDRFAHVEACPFEGPRVFFENAGGSLHLKAVAESAAFYAGLPDNQGRANPASRALMAAIARGRADMARFFNAPGGQVLVGESGSELLFRLVRTAAMGAEAGGATIGSTLEHPALSSAMAHWADATGRPLIAVAHDDADGTVTAAAYRAALRPDLRVASIIHTSPVTGMAVDVAAIAAEIRAVAPDCLIVVDGIQHASHGAVDVAALGVDGYAISPYKMFARHGFGVAWASDRLTACAKEQLRGGPADAWELGTRDTGAYAAFSEVMAYLDWLGGQVSDATEPRARLQEAARAIAAHEGALTRAMLHGAGNQPGLAQLPGICLIGGDRVAGREGVISFALAGRDAAEIVAALGARGIRVHTRKADHYSGNVLRPLGLDSCVRVSICHYNTMAEVTRLLAAMREIASPA
jgi:cysteine desulfurase/selenocysteine lyase